MTQPPSQPYPYGQQPPQPYYQPGPPVGVPASGKATASLVLGILGIFMCGLTSIAGIITGHLALGETRDGRKTGRGQAVWGVILSWLTAAPWLIFWGMVIAGAVSAPFLPASPTPTFTP